MSTSSISDNIQLMLKLQYQPTVSATTRVIQILAYIKLLYKMYHFMIYVFRIWLREETSFLRMGILTNTYFYTSKENELI